MTTHHRFKSTLKPFTDFDDDELQSSRAIVPSSSVDSALNQSRLLFTALLDHVCSIYAKTPQKREQLFHVMCEALIKTQIMVPALSATEFVSIRHQYQKKFIQLVNTALQAIDEDVIIAQSSIRIPSMQAILSSRLLTEPSLETFTTSKLAVEFSNICQIGRGAYGKVCKAMKKSDGREYAVKGIVFKADDQPSVQKTFCEVKFLAGLSHQNVIRYYDNWLETSILDNFFTTDEDEMDSESASDCSKPVQPQRRSDCAVSNSLPYQAPSASNESSIEFERNGMDDNESNDKFNKCTSQAIVPRFKHLSNSAYNRTSRPTCKHVLYIQMELCNTTLKDWLEARNYRTHVEINDDENKRLLKQILKGIDYIHSKQLIHRDLKPQNIFLQDSANGSSIVKIGDFGLATLFATKSNATLSDYENPYVDGADCEATAELTKGIGTALYASPEQLKTQKYNNKSDMYSLGVILYEFYHPFGTESERRNCLVKLREEGLVEEKMKANWPRQAELVENLTCGKPERRPSAKELLEGGLFLSKDQIITELRRENLDLRQQLSMKDIRITELERLLETRQFEIRL